MQENIKENKMGTMPVNKLLISMSLPIVVSMLVQALYNVVDSMFVARLSESALTAVSLAFPMQNLIIATSTGIGVGINALLSKKLGMKDYKGADNTAHQGVIIILVCYFIFLVLGLTFTKTFFKLQTTDPEIIEYGTQYLSICLIFSFGVFTQITFERLLQATGKTIYTMFIQGTGAIINIILDWVLIFGKFGFPKMGVAGAAVATVVGQIVAGILGIVFNHYKNQYVKIRLSKFVPDFKIISRILAVGIPSIIMASIGSIMTFSLNKILMAFTSTATAVFGVYFKLQSFVFMPIFGLNNGMVPIIAYNYGAKNKDRLIKTVKLSLMYSVSLMLIGFTVFQTAPNVLLSLFDASENMVQIGVPALRTISFSFIFAGGCIVLISVLQALGNGIYSMFISIARQLVVLIPLAFLFSLTGVLNYVWLAFPIAEFVSIVLCIILFLRMYNKHIKNL
ncbi:MAG: MATE family efflux transporter [Clostridia bacterium]|nr:MATE family efflux transporter [Clostridia bacterium]